ncbi:MAG TPA: type II toxin-antitoxin system mRNA interferase toxin, RelE/StbE family [Cyanobacteria bacterium UBA11149]|nr:type II toxin-antitoxin system mRNA interferase toxin, RelE/StbE family [Cyanobacteria bacterium UBA11367]HBE56060.1 type II toxin-antitoxin system mRNA interferase toxin, RelE/StbE family [Cyanobacteria bacterium UBA11366]HBK64543.1 type II toxin-antitoxin system mRNA interferase toxin, RelE/StbE family [Cyanobacteria bacterium UBA11166]HBR77019.1 type II toxin-antitoxin system mRNA interferase toxin, RelE/StbE family [Cyanobacteria bacterium UBA11159]HBS70982.1 type II toxin-antitoxin syst
MRKIITTNQFKKDLKRLAKRGKFINKLEEAIDKLQAGINLEQRYRNHQLIGNWFPYWECHIESDWLLIYQQTETELILIRTGTHSDLFD